MQFKAKLGMLAAAVALSFGAQAANVTLYGSVSTCVVLSGTAKLTEAGETTDKRSTNLAWKAPGPAIRFSV